MRQIKFRAWDIENKQMSWPFSIYETPTWELGGGGYTLSDEDFAKAPIMQYTGLKDKKGKEIYEGDILLTEQVEKYKYVCWLDYGWMPFLRHYLQEPRFLLSYKHTEVIGNIHQNPELMEE